MPIEFPCTTCGQLVRTPESAAGKKGKCPHCASIVQIPAAGGQGTGDRGQGAVERRRTEDRGQGTGSRGQGTGGGAPAAGGAVISFPCGSCGQTVRTPMSAAGKKGKCPHCHAVVQIPGGPAPTTPPAAATVAGLTPLAPLPSQQRNPAAAPKPAPSGPWKGTPTQQRPAPARPAAPPAEHVEELPTLTPIDSTPGLTPLPPQGAGLTPLGPAGGLTPLGPAPAGGLTPLADPFGGLASMGGDPLAGLPAANISGRTLGPAAIPNPLGASPGYGGAALNPYASPAGGAAYSAGYSDFSDAVRKGLPWERRADMESFQDTATLILSEPQNAFMQMRRTGGLMNSLAFWIVAAIIGQVANTVYGGILGMILLAIGNAPGEAYAALAVSVGLQLVGGLIGTIIFAPVGAFIGAAIWHVVLLVFGCARGGFEATFRAQCFVGGAVVLLNIIPILGPLIGFFYGIALFIHAFTHAHEVSGGRATAAVLTLYGLLCCCISPLIIFPLMGLIARLGAGGPF
ncbi:MAG TPA: YIP1 family protein [Pirellulaceae bacterium]|nr:YIP1 family protein [Pirellulaceae bacterium]